MWGEEIPGRVASKFCVVIGTQDVITCIEFGDFRLRGFWLAGCQSLPFSVDFAGRPYNMLRCRVHCDCCNHLCNREINGTFSPYLTCALVRYEPAVE